MARGENGERKRISKEALKKSMGIFRYVLPYKWIFTVGLICLLISSVSSVMIFSSLGDIVDAQKGQFARHVKDVILFMGVMLVVQAVTSYLRIYTFSIVTENAIAHIRQDVYSRLVRLPMTYFATRRVGELSSRISSDISTVQGTFTTYLAELIRQIIVIIVSVVIMGATSLNLALFMVATLPAMALFAVFFGRYVRKVSKKTQEHVAESTTIVEETLQGIATVKAFTGELFEILRYKKSTNELIRYGMKYSRIRGLFASFIIVFVFGAVIAIVWYGSLLVSQGVIKDGDLIRFFMLSAMVAGSVGGLADTYSQIQKAVGATEHLLGILDEKPEIDQPQENHLNEKFIRGAITFQKVSFTYPSRKDYPVLQNLNFTILPGEQVAIVGPSGAGKSTLTAMILRFYKPDQGQIEVDGKNAEEYDLGAYRSQIALVPQDILLFGGSIRENIRYSKPNATDEEIIEAAKKANAHDFISEFPQGYDTVVGERGTKLSGGQRQRVAIARAVLSDPAILLLDEATSSLDSESERLVQDALDKLMKGRTSIVIAHRLSTIRNADKILVMDKGELKEMGTHEELIARENGLYRHLSELQFGI